MNSTDHEQIRKLVKNAIAPMRERNLERDLWPQIERRLHEPEIQIPLLDWVLIALVVIICFFIPESVPALLYNL